MMYNLKFGCDQLLKKLRKEGFKAVYIGEYPFHKVYNSKHQERIRDSEIQFVTDATLDKLKEMFDVIEVKDSFEKQYFDTSKNLNIKKEQFGIVAPFLFKMFLVCQLNMGMLN